MGEKQRQRWPAARWRLWFFCIIFLVFAIQSCAGARYSLQGISPHSEAEFTRVVITTDGPVRPKIGRLAEPDRLYLDLPNTHLTPDWATHNITVADGRLQTIQVTEPKRNYVRIIFELDTFEQYRVSTQTAPYRVVAELLGKNGRKQTETNTNAKAINVNAPQRPLTIVLDPGHGGKDSGAIGPTGLEEKAFVLRVAKELRRVLQRELPQARIILTRDQDIFIPLKDRTKIANQHKADLFVSLHANSSPNREASGIETWYLSFAANDRAKRQAARENMMATGQLSDLELILRHLQETDRINQSATLAQITQAALSRHMLARYPDMTDRGIEGAPFVVLLHTAMPSVLVELSFISNPQEEQRMRSAEYHRSLAQGVFQGLQRFLQTAVTAVNTKG